MQLGWKKNKLRFKKKTKKQKTKTEGKEDLFNEIRAKNFLDLGKEMDIHTQEALRTPDKYNQRTSP